MRLSIIPMVFLGALTATTVSAQYRVLPPPVPQWQSPPQYISPNAGATPMFPQQWQQQPPQWYQPPQQQWRPPVVLQWQSPPTQYYFILPNAGATPMYSWR